jgi:hypothetical protein
VLDREIVARAHVAFQAARLLRRHRNVQATLKVLALRIGRAIWTATELAGGARATLEVVTRGRGLFVGTAPEFGL